MPHEERPTARRPCSGAWRTWLAIGATGFGGPAAQVALLHREVVVRKGWLDEDEFMAALRVCTLLPGPEAQQLATYAGWRVDGMRGALLAGTLFVAPGALLVTALSWLYAAGGRTPFVSAAFAGVRPAVVALVALAAWRIGRKSLRSVAAVALAMTAGVALVWGVPFPAVLVVAALVGVIAPAGTLQPTPAAEPGVAPAALQPAFPHACRVVAVTLAVWAACYGVVSVTHAAGGRGPAIARLFTETTAASFGGAYAIVPWALDESVHRGWIEPSQRFTAVAMGEATPGPLILVVTFLGFMAGWNAGPAEAAAALEGAVTATVFAFIPSFALVLAVAPVVRSLRPESGAGKALAAVGSAVVAAIVIFGAKLAAATLVTDGRPDVMALVVTAASVAALAWARIPTPLVVLAAAAIAVLRHAR